MNRHLIIPLVAVTIAGATAFAITPASAQTAGGVHTNLVQRIAEKFNLNEAEVQDVFDDLRDEHRAEMQQTFTDRLTTAVENGKLTETQKAVILTKHQEMMTEHEADRDALKDLAPQERREHHETERAELEAWASEQGIDLNYLLPMGKMGGRHMRGAYGAPAEFDKD